MGADFLFCDIPYAKINKERRKLLLDAAKKVTLENFRDPSWDNNLEAQATMRRCVEWYTNDPLGRRDVISIRQEGAIYESLITGGLSWVTGRPTPTM